MSSVLVDRDRDVLVVTINRPEVRNAVDVPTAEALFHAFQEYDRDDRASVAVLTGAGGTFCAGADLKAIAAGEQRRLTEDAPAPLGPTRLLLSKPVLAAVEGHAVAGGLELALWCDLRVAAVDAVFGVFCRRFGVPLLDLGTVRLPRLIGHSHAMDLILTGRGVQGEEALRMGLVNRLVPTWPGPRRRGSPGPRAGCSSPSAASGPTGYRRTSSGRSPTRTPSATSFVAASRSSSPARPWPARRHSPAARAATGPSDPGTPRENARVSLRRHPDRTPDHLLIAKSWQRQRKPVSTGPGTARALHAGHAPGLRAHGRVPAPPAHGHRALPDG